MPEYQTPAGHGKTFAVTEDLHHVLRRDEYQPPKWVYATEVEVQYPDGVRRLDGVAVNVHDRPFLVEGFELKVSRSDWLHELQDPSKHQPGHRAVDRFWFVAGAPGIIKADEVPEDCGAMQWTGSAFEVLRVAPRPRFAAAVAAYDRAFLSAVLRRALHDPDDMHGFVNRVKREAEDRGYRKGINAGRRRHQKQDEEWPLP